MFPVENRKFSAIPGFLFRFTGWPFRFSYNNFASIYNLFVLVIMAVTKRTMQSVSNRHICLVFLRTVSFSGQTLLLNSITFTAKSIDYGDIHYFLFPFFFPSSSFSKVFWPIPSWIVSLFPFNRATFVTFCLSGFYFNGREDRYKTPDSFLLPMGRCM